jgi:U4/U6 small nuclear ribonucleoprotein PRP3
VGLHPLLSGEMASQPGTSPLLIARANFATVKSNQKMAELKMKAAIGKSATTFETATLKIEKPPADFMDPTKNPYFDPKLQGARPVPKAKFSRAMKFAPQGKFIEQANQIRQEVPIQKTRGVKSPLFN